MGVTFLGTPVDLWSSLTKDTYDDVDLSSVASGACAGASFVLLHVHRSAAGDHTFGSRAKGDTSDNKFVQSATSHSTVWVPNNGAGANTDIIQIFAATSAAAPEIWLVGYTDSDFVPMADQSSTYQISGPTTGSWQNHDLTSWITGGDTPTHAIFLALNNSGLDRTINFRSGASTDNRLNKIEAKGSIVRGLYYVCQVEDNSGFNIDYYVESSLVTLQFIGYVKNGAPPADAPDGTDVSLGSTGSFLDLTGTNANMETGFFEIGEAAGAANDYTYGMRPNGDTTTTHWNIVDGVYGGTAHMVVAAASNVIEAQIANTALDMFYHGGFDAAGGATGAIVIGNVQLSASGVMVPAGAGAITLGNVQIAASGVEEIAGAAAIQIGNAIVSAMGSAGSNDGVGVVALSKVVLQAAGFEEFTAQSAIVIGNAIVAATGAAGTDGQGVVTLANVILAAAGVEQIDGAGAVNLAHAVISASGRHPVVGTAAIQLAAIQIAASGVGGEAAGGIGNLIGAWRRRRRLH